MDYTLGHTETDICTVIFQMNTSNFEIQTPKRTSTVYESDIEEQGGKFFFNIPKTAMSGFQNVRSIEIPADVLEGRDEYLAEIENSKGNIGSTETVQGKVYFYLTSAGMIKAKLGELEELTDTFYTVEGKRVICFSGLGNPFVVIPEGVEKAFRQVKWDKEQKSKYLIYAGRSLLTGKDYFRFSCDVSQDTMNRVKGQFTYFELGDFGTLEGWLTATPELVEQYLRIRNPVSNEKSKLISSGQQQ